jgi:ATPase family protein associated with various cellular activities (AAA)/winged helix domain-containing protein
LTRLPSIGGFQASTDSGAPGLRELHFTYVTGALACVRRILEESSGDVTDGGGDLQQAELAEVRLQLEAAAGRPPALDRLCKTFDLSAFERNVLLLCAGVELDGRFAALCGSVTAKGERTPAPPTFRLAIERLPNPDWGALSPGRPLRYWRLLHIGTADSITRAPLRIDERVLHFLLGTDRQATDLAGYSAVGTSDLTDGRRLVDSHAAVAQQIFGLWSPRLAQEQGFGVGLAPVDALPVVQLCGPDRAAKLVIAAAVCARLGGRLLSIPARDIPADHHELETFTRLCEREYGLGGCIVLVDCDDQDLSDADRRGAVADLLEYLAAPALVASSEPLHLKRRPRVRLDVDKPRPREQRAVWHHLAGPQIAELDECVNELVGQFHLSVPAIEAAWLAASADQPPAEVDHRPVEHLRGAALWDACRVQARQHMSELGERIEPTSQWDDLTVPERTRHALRQIVEQVRQRWRVYHEWGFGARSMRGLGTSAMFAGPSGTGKTMAAEILAGDLHLDLYRIDLSATVSKWVGETAKNLRRIFDAAEEGGAVLLFDEADALFNKRSQVKDSHDRYANVEISYLLQRMEAYRGLAILTSNREDDLDAAFLRRLRFIVRFPFPDALQRAEIWRRVFPPTLPVEGLDISKLAALNVSGAVIRNIAMNAAFAAAHAGAPVQMVHILEAARTEYDKLKQPLSAHDTRDWV